MRIITGEDAYELFRHNKAFRWAQHKADNPHAPSRTGKLGMLPNLTPKFRMGDNEKIFTIGSCFAREIETALQTYGYTFATQNPDNHVTLEECSSPNGFFNKFTTASMLNEVRWALGESFPQNGFMENGNGRWMDGQLHASFATRERAEYIRNRVSRVFAEVRDARYLIITLGLVECWHDAETDLYLNIAPPGSAVKRYPGRFSVHVLDYRSNYASLQEIYDRVKAANPDIRLIVTVSPVPLAATFTGEDIVIANAYSKSTLRAVAGDFVQGKTDVDYFPSYEAVTESAPSIAWLEDAIHVRKDLVNCVVAHFLKHYGSPELSAKVNVEAELAALGRRAKLLASMAAEKADDQAIA